MRLRSRIRGVAAAALIVTACALAADEPEKKPAADPMLEMYVDLAKTVPEHKRLAALTGTWKITNRLWFDPAKPPVEARGTATGRLILGGRFVQLEASTGAPLPMETLTLMGFDRRTSDYTMVGFDTLGTYYITAAGRHDPKLKAIVLNGTYAQPPTGVEQKYRFVLEGSESKQLFTLFFTMADGRDVKVAETIYER